MEDFFSLYWTSDPLLNEGYDMDMLYLVIGPTRFAKESLYSVSILLSIVIGSMTDDASGNSSFWRIAAWICSCSISILTFEPSVRPTSTHCSFRAHLNANGDLLLRLPMFPSNRFMLPDGNLTLNEDSKPQFRILMPYEARLDND